MPSLAFSVALWLRAISSMSSIVKSVFRTAEVLDGRKQETHLNTRHKNKMFPKTTVIFIHLLFIAHEKKSLAFLSLEYFQNNLQNNVNEQLSPRCYVIQCGIVLGIKSKSRQIMIVIGLRMII